MSHFTSFAVAGGSGMLGSQIVAGLVAAGAQRVIVLSRSAETAVPNGVEIKVVDFTSPASLESALVGVDVVINALSSSASSLEVALAEASKAANVKLYVPGQFGTDARFIDPTSPMSFKRKFLDTLKELELPALRFSFGVFPTRAFAPPLGFNFAQNSVNVIGSLDSNISFTMPRDAGAFIGQLLVKTPAEKLIELEHVTAQGDRVNFSQIISAYEETHPGTKLEVSTTTLPEAFVQLAALQGFAQMAVGMRVAWAKGDADVTRGETVAVDNALVEGWKPITVKEYLTTL